MSTVDVRMPKMGESITEGTVITWHKKVGDIVELDETLLEIGTDKVDTDVPSPCAGTVSEILVPEGETVAVGTVIASLQTEAAEETAEVPNPAASAPASLSAAHSADIPVVMPRMGESITEGTVISWHKKVGDAVEMDEVLLEIGTDKVDTDVPSPASGIVKELLVAEDATVEVGTVIAMIGSSEQSRPAAAAQTPPVSAQEVVPASKERSTAGAATAPGRQLDDGRFLSPLVRSIARKEGLSSQDLAAITGSGREGRLTKKDILNFLEHPVATTSLSPPSGERVEIVEMDRMRQLIAQHMRHSKDTAAHVTSFAEADVTQLVRLREANKERFMEQEGVRLTYTPFLVHAAVEALREHPLMNASVDGDKILMHKDYHVGIAVAIGKTGLVVPVIRHAGRISITGLAHAANDLAQRARSRDLQPDDLQGGTFTVTNVGSLGSLMGTPIILQPQVAILATGTVRKRPVVVEDPELGDVIAIRSMMYLSLSYDHRIVDGAMGISFLRHYIASLENYDEAALI